MEKKETLFVQLINKDPVKKNIYLKALQDNKIRHFDPNTMSKLKRMFFGYLSGIIYMYYTPTTETSIGNKVEMLSVILKDKEMSIVHGDTDSARIINSIESESREQIKFNSWIEVVEGNKTWVYDPFSMMMIDKDVYYELEHPTIKQIIPKNDVNYILSQSSDKFDKFNDAFGFMLYSFIEKADRNFYDHPFSDILVPELSRFKQAIHYDDCVLEWKDAGELKRAHK